MLAKIGVSEESLDAGADVTAGQALVYNAFDGAECVRGGMFPACYYDLLFTLAIAVLIINGFKGAASDWVV